MKQKMTFISYSRRQLYFAESLALHLQKEGIDIWFDLQKLQAGTVWSEGLKDGVGDAHKMVLVVSQASLESPYTQAEWKEFVGKGNQLVLAIYEPVDIPDELRGLPTYDFRSGFNSKLRDLAAFLKGDAEPRHDHIAPVKRFGIPAKLPVAIGCILAALFGPLIACFLGLIFAIMLNPNELWQQATTYTISSATQFFLVMVGLSLLLGFSYAVPLLRHKLEIKKVKRGLGRAMILLVPAYFAVGNLQGEDNFASIYQEMFLIVLAFTLFVYFFMLRSSIGLLRWMQPEEALQNLRRRAHQPLVAKASFDVDAAADCEGKAFTYAIHADPADEPVVRWVKGIFKKAGHKLVEPDKTPENHIAILSNRSSADWAQKITAAYAGKLAFVVVSTIEFKDSLTETGRYQWVDARAGDQLDINGLARSLGNVDAWKREAALEVTPALIDRWKVPTGITLLKWVMELLAIFVLVFGLTDLIGFVMCWFGIPKECEEGLNVVRAISLVMVGTACFWLSSRALVYRKVSFAALLGFLGVIFALVMWQLVYPDEKDFNAEPLTLWTEYWYVAPSVILSMLLYGLLSSRFWLPAFSTINPDEVGIKKSIDQAFKKRNVIILSAWVIVIVGIAMAIYFKWMK